MFGSKIKVHVILGHFMLDFVCLNDNIFSSFSMDNDAFVKERIVYSNKNTHIVTHQVFAKFAFQSNINIAHFDSIFYSFEVVRYQCKKKYWQKEEKKQQRQQQQQK